MKKQATVLLADDEELILDLLSFELDQAGFKVLKAENGKKALEVCLKHDVDLVITDIRMPGTSGFSLVKKLRASAKPEIPVLFITGFASHQFGDLTDLGAVGVLSKPFESSTLISKIKLILSNIEEEKAELE